MSDQETRRTGPKRPKALKVIGALVAAPALLSLVLMVWGVLLGKLPGATLGALIFGAIIFMIVALIGGAMTNG